MEKENLSFTLGDPEEELKNFFASRIKHFKQLDCRQKLSQYERSYRIALAFLREAKGQGEKYAP